jgi:hypothetical protein
MSSPDLLDASLWQQVGSSPWGRSLCAAASSCIAGKTSNFRRGAFALDVSGNSLLPSWSREQGPGHRRAAAVEWRPSAARQSNATFQISKIMSQPGAILYSLSIQAAMSSIALVAEAAGLPGTSVITAT